jgi:cytochrome o ubiquinol oxidase subunit 1
MFAGMTYWFPKAFGFKLDEFWGKVAFWGWVIGYWVAWTPIYIVGLMGTTRRVRHFDDPTLQPWFIIAGIGALIILVGIVGFVIQIAVSIKNREKLRDATGDPWDGRTLEWSTTSPPPAYNFAFTPVVSDLDAWYDMKERGYKRPSGGFRPIHMPRNTGAGVVISAIALVLGFSMIWSIWWLAALSFVGLVAAVIIHSFNYDRDYYVPVEEVERTENGRGQPALAGA